MSSKLTSVTLSLIFGTGLLCHAQSPQGLAFNFSYRSAAQPTPAFVTPNSTVTIPDTLVGSSTPITFTVENANRFDASVAISTDNTLFTAGARNMTVPAQSTSSVDIRFTPAKAGAAFGTLTLQILTSTQAVTYTFYLVSSGTAPLMSASYILPGGNQSALTSANGLTFQPTSVGATVTATIVITNSGTGAGTLDQASLTGAAFQLSGLPLLPAKLLPGGTLQFLVSFAPTAIGPAAGQLHLSWNQDRTDLVFGVSGSGLGAVWKYSVKSGSQTTAISPNGTIQAPDANVGTSKTLIVQVSNAGTAKGTIGNIQLTGSDFRISDVLPLPTTLQPNDVFTITIAFTPSSPGTSTGFLSIDSAKFSLSGVGIGAALQFTYVSSSGATILAANAAVNFPNTQIGTRTTGTIQVQNTGNSPSSLNAVSVTGASFSLAGVPALPISLSANESASFSIVFAPGLVGSQSGSLQVDNLTFPLRGVGSAPPPIGQVMLTPASAQVSTMQQSSLQVTLAKPYPFDLSGVLSMAFTSAAIATDPALQFAAGGRTIQFTIPANTTEAVFGSQGKSAAFQTGSIAGTITFGATLALGTVDNTPDPAPSTSLGIQSAPPQVRTVQIGTRTPASFELLITGYTPMRSVSQLLIQFTPADGVNLGTTSISTAVDQAFGSWFQNPASVSYGSQFSASVVVGINGNPNGVKAVSVTLSNSIGSGSPVTANFQ